MIDVHSHVRGSKCVVWLHDIDTYIDARRDTRYPDFNFIEVVTAGQVKRRVNVYERDAPQVIVQLMHELILTHKHGPSVAALLGLN